MSSPKTTLAALLLLTAVAPAGTATQYIRVTTPGGTTADTAADDFTYIPAPTVTNVAPGSGPTIGGSGRA